jgi:hypothetical protein
LLRVVVVITILAFVVGVVVDVVVTTVVGSVVVVSGGGVVVAISRLILRLMLLQLALGLLIFRFCWRAVGEAALARCISVRFVALVRCCAAPA